VKNQDKIIKGKVKSEGSLVGSWRYLGDGEQVKDRGIFVIRVSFI